MKKATPTEVVETDITAYAKAIVEELYNTNPLEVINAKDGYEYGWFAVDQNHPQCTASARSRGWEEVKESDPERNRLGSVRFKDLQLMRRRIEIREAINEARKRKTDELIRSAERTYFNIRDDMDKLERDGAKDKTIVI